VYLFYRQHLAFVHDSDQVQRNQNMVIDTSPLDLEYWNFKVSLMGSSDCCSLLLIYYHHLLCTQRMLTRKIKMVHVVNKLRNF